MSKKVFFIGPSAYTLGGIQTWLDYVVPGVAMHGWESVLVLTSGQHHDAQRYLQVHPMQNTLTLNNPSGLMQGRIEAIEQLFIDHRPDLVVVLNIVDVYQAIRNLRKRGDSCPQVIASMHGIHPGLVADFEFYKDTIDTVVSTNRLAQKLVTQKAGITPARSLYAPYGVKLAQHAVTNSQRSSQFTLAYVGRIEEDQKRFADVLQIFTGAIERFPDIKILIAGDGEQRASLDAWMAQAEHKDHVSYLGVLNHQELDQQVYQQSDALLLTSHWETGPIVAWEAMNQGTLLISSKYIGYKEEGSLIDEENCLLFEIGDIEGALEKIEQARDVSLKEQLIENATLLLQNKYTEEKSIQSWVDCFESVLAQPRLAKSVGPQAQQDKGRLNSLFGPAFSHMLRKLFRVRFEHSEPGSEWPHSYSGHPSDSKYLLEYVGD